MSSPARRARRRSRSGCRSTSACSRRRRCASARSSSLRRRARASARCRAASWCARGSSRRVGPRPASTSEAGSPGAGSTSCCGRTLRASSAGGAGSVASPTGCARTSSVARARRRAASGWRSSAASCWVTTTVSIDDLRDAFRASGLAHLTRRVGAERRHRRRRDRSARVAARLGRAGRPRARDRGDRRLCARRRLGAVRRSGRRRRLRRLARLARLATRRPLARSGARRAGPPRLAAGVAARAGVPAVVRGRGGILARRAAVRALAEGYPVPGRSCWAPRCPSRAASSPRRSAGSTSARSPSGACRRTSLPSRRCRSCCGSRSLRRPSRRSSRPRRSRSPGSPAGCAAWIAGCARLFAVAAARAGAVLRGLAVAGPRCRRRRCDRAARPPARRRGEVAVAVGRARLRDRASGGGRCDAHVTWRPPDGLRVTFLDVGQGDGILLETPNAAVLVDQGPPEARVADQLRAMGIRSLSAVVLTHPQRDHVGGAADVLRRLAWARCWIRRSRRTPATRRPRSQAAARRSPGRRRPAR